MTGLYYTQALVSYMCETSACVITISLFRLMSIVLKSVKRLAIVTLYLLEDINYKYFKIITFTRHAWYKLHVHVCGPFSREYRAYGCVLACLSCFLWSFFLLCPVCHSVIFFNIVVNFNFASNFWTLSPRALIVPIFFILWSWPWSLAYFLKTLTLIIIFEQLTCARALIF